MSTAGKKKTTSTGKSSKPAKAEAAKADSKREDGGQGAGAPAFIAELKSPKQPAESRHYLDSVDRFQEEISHTEYRVVKAFIPTEFVPELHKGPHAGFPVAHGDSFEVKLNTGQTITAKE